jgi:hypothetical protein
VQQNCETLERAKGVVGISSEHSLPFKRILVEGLVIVASILLAFGIDAAWDVRHERRAEDQLLRTLLAEIDANDAELAHGRAQGARARSAQSKLIDLIGPQSGTLSVDSLGALLRTSLSFGTVEIESAALDAVLAGTAPSTQSRTDLLRLLRHYRTELEDHRLEDRRQWIDNRSEISQYLKTVSPYAFVWADLAGHSPTDFDIPVAALLRDQRLEGLVSQLSIRARQMTASIETLTVLADSIAILATAEAR